MFPCCIFGTSIDRRICRQSGNFTIHGSLVWPIDFRSIVQKEIHKIFIPYSCIDEIRNWLTVLDITENSIYGDSILDLISTSVTEKERDKFLSSISKLIEKYKNYHTPISY